MTDSSQTGPDAANGDEKSPIEQLMELLVYAPVGLAYEYEDVLPKLIKRGKSQVQLAKVMSQMAAKQGQTKAKESTVDPEQLLGDVLGQAASILAKGITEFGQAVGLAPVEDTAAEGTAGEEPVPAEPAAETSAPDTTDEVAALLPTATLLPPIAGYDELKAREIVPLLEDLSPEQRDRVRGYEESNRGRATVLAQLDKLAD